MFPERYYTAISMTALLVMTTINKYFYDYLKPSESVTYIINYILCKKNFIHAMLIMFTC